VEKRPDFSSFFASGLAQERRIAMKAAYRKHAPIWDLFLGDRTREIECWDTLACKYGSKILSPMAATGEIGAALSSRGYSVTILELEKEMIKEGRRKYGKVKNLSFAEADVRDFSLEEKNFDFSFIGTADFHHFLSRSDQLSALKCLYNHIRPGGGLGLELWYPPENSRVTPWREYHPFRPAGEGLKVKKKGRTIFSKPGNRVRIEQEIFVEYNGEKEQFRHDIALQLLEPREVFDLLERTGFLLINEFGNYDLDPRKDNSTGWIVEARKK